MPLLHLPLFLLYLPLPLLHLHQWQQLYGLWALAWP